MHFKLSVPLMKLFFSSIASIFILLFIAPGCQKDQVNKVPVADAGIAQSIRLPQDTATLNGSGKDADGTVVAYMWTEISGPDVATIVNNGSASSVVRGLVTGVYIFQLAVTDNEGATGTDTVLVTVHDQDVHTLTLQPDQNPTEVHIYGNGNNLEGSTTAAPEIGVAAWTDQGYSVGMRALLKFDLSSIPANATIVSAKLTLFSNPTPLNGNHVNPNSGDNNAMLIEQVVSSWDPALVKWFNQPAVTSNNEILIPHTAEGLLDLVDVDVLKLVSTMVTTSNNGFLLRLQSEVAYNSRIFCSSKYPDATKHPRLVIEYK